MKVICPGVLNNITLYKTFKTLKHFSTAFNTIEREVASKTMYSFLVRLHFINASAGRVHRIQR